VLLAPSYLITDAEIATLVERLAAALADALKETP
jgi:adenosylmethionine-8-amino-7-oxononanoate aminotransferase